MLDIFVADRVFIISSLGSDYSEIKVSYEEVREGFLSIKDNESAFLAEIEQGLLHRAEYNEFPLISTDTGASENQETLLASYNDRFKIQYQMIKSLRLRDNQTWFLVIHQCADSRSWSELEQETFYRISIRLTNLLSRYMLMESLRHSEHLLQQAQRIGHLGNWSWNAKTDQLTWSDEIYRIYGYEPGSFIPARDEFFKVIFEEDDARIQLFEHTTSGSAETYSIEHRIRLPDDKTRWVHEQGVGSFHQEGHLLEINGTVQDITETIRKRNRRSTNKKWMLWASLQVVLHTILAI